MPDSSRPSKSPEYRAAAMKTTVILSVVVGVVGLVATGALGDDGVNVLREVIALVMGGAGGAALARR